MLPTSEPEERRGRYLRAREVTLKAPVNACYGVYWQTGSLLPAIAVHAAWNFRWFQVAALGSHPLLLGQWPTLDLLVLTGVLTTVAASTASRRNLTKRSSASV